MKFQVTVIEVDGTEETFGYEQSPDYTVLRDWVGGYIEAVPFFDIYAGKHCVAFCNEEGKLKGLPYNAKANTLWQDALEFVPYAISDVLVGPIVIIAANNRQDLQEL